MLSEGITHAYNNQVLVVNPVRIHQLDDDLDLIMESLDKKAGPDKNPRDEDVFNRFPPELRHEVFKLLPAGSILALKAASWAMHISPLPHDFWKQMLKVEVPWLWEIHEIDVFQSQDLEDRTSKLLLEIQKKSQYTSKNDDYILGLANRRRIWGVCKQIQCRYLEKLGGM